jgi:hypothetical protein
MFKWIVGGTKLASDVIRMGKKDICVNWRAKGRIDQKLRRAEEFKGLNESLRRAENILENVPLIRSDLHEYMEGLRIEKRQLVVCMEEMKERNWRNEKSTK